MKHATTIHPVSDRNLSFYYLALLFVIAAALMLKQLVIPGYYSIITDDTVTYTRWAWQFNKALREGITYPRWMPYEFWDYGSPTFILYSPLSFYLVAFFNLFTGSILGAMNIAKFFSLFLAGTGMFFLIKEFFPRKTAFLAAAFYIMFPYTIFQVYCFGSFAAIVSWLWYSPIFLFTNLYFKSRHYKHLIYAGICYGGLILTYLIHAYMLSFVLTAFIIIMSVTTKSRGNILALPVIFAIGVLVSAAYLLPLIFELKYLNLNAFITEGNGFSFSDFFILPKLTSNLSPTNFWASYYNVFAYQILSLSIIILWLSIKTIKHNANRALLSENMAVLNKIFLSTAVWSMFLLFGISNRLWEIIPFFKFIQFPVRWLNITVFSVSVLFASFVYIAKKTSTSIRTHYNFVFLVFLTLIFVDYYYINNAPVFTEDELLHTKSIRWAQEHLPRGVEMARLGQVDAPIEKTVILEGEGKAEIADWKTAERVINITAKQPIIIRIRTFNFPGWTAYIDGKLSQIASEAGSKAMLVKVPKGTHRLELIFSDTPVRYYGKFISLTSLIVFSAVLLVNILFFRQSSSIE